MVVESVEQLLKVHRMWLGIVITRTGSKSSHNTSTDNMFTVMGAGDSEQPG
jgi:hypothetical protein